MRKKFDQELHDKTDFPARTKAKRIIEKLGYLPIDNPNIHGVDLLVYNDLDEHVFNCEVEQKATWIGKNFPFPDVNFLERKGKYCRLSKPTYFILFNEDFSNYLSIKDKDVISSPIEIVANRFVPWGEKFYKIDLKNVNFNKLKL